MFVVVPVFPTGGWNLMRVDGMRAAMVAYYLDETLADRVCLLLNRFGEQDSYIAPDLLAAAGTGWANTVPCQTKDS